MLEMLENLKASFQITQAMENCENLESLPVEELVHSVGCSQRKLAKTGNNSLKFDVDQLVPKSLTIKKNLVKRVVNNMLTNSLKHTQNGSVNVNISMTDTLKATDAQKFMESAMTVGAVRDPGQN